MLSILKKRPTENVTHIDPRLMNKLQLHMNVSPVLHDLGTGVRYDKDSGNLTVSSWSPYARDVMRYYASIQNYMCKLAYIRDLDITDYLDFPETAIIWGKESKLGPLLAARDVCIPFMTDEHVKRAYSGSNFDVDDGASIYVRSLVEKYEDYQRYITEVYPTRSDIFIRFPFDPSLSIIDDVHMSRRRLEQHILYCLRIRCTDAEIETITNAQIFYKMKKEPFGLLEKLQISTKKRKKITEIL